MGELLVEAGLLSQEQLAATLRDQKQSNLKLGQLLVRRGIIGERQIMDLVSRQLKIDQYNSEKYPVDLDMAKLVSLELAQKYQVAPLKKQGYLLTIAMADPMDINALDSIEVATNSEVQPVVCTEQELNNLISSLYGMYSGLDGVMESIGMEVHREGEEIVEDQSEEIGASSLQDLAEQAPVIRLVNSIITQAVHAKASDIHFTPEKGHIFLQFRIDGKLQDVPSPAKSMFLPIISRIKILANMDIASSRIPQDGRLTVRIEKREINIRVSTMPTIYGENMVLRLLDMSSGVYSMERLGMAELDMGKIRSMINKPYGMILSTGPTGSGKSSSLYAILKEIYRPELNIITLEDPVEYRMPRIRQVQLNRKAGMTFASGLRAILRQDPDVIMVGEIRDAETAAIAVQAALTGHLVLSTVHTNNAAGAITRLLDMHIEPFLVSTVLLVSFAQRLVRKICPHCSEPYTPPATVLQYWGLTEEESSTIRHGRGCFHCNGTGYLGRTGIFETLVMDPLIQNMALQRMSAQEITRAAKQTGKLHELREDALDKVLRGITTLEEASSAVAIS
ncbi:MAG: GspE/PulE family protein [Desulfobulbaceae bacterium]|nr:GspE/PulE family protein [Desulfobulbaceae bacterium]